jgi:hypothetical protein
MSSSAGPHSTIKALDRNRPIKRVRRENDKLNADEIPLLRKAIPGTHAHFTGDHDDIIKIEEDGSGATAHELLSHKATGDQLSQFPTIENVLIPPPTSEPELEEVCFGVVGVLLASSQKRGITTSTTANHCRRKYHFQASELRDQINPIWKTFSSKALALRTHSMRGRKSVSTDTLGTVACLMAQQL